MLSLSKAANYNDNRYDVCPQFFFWCRFAVDSQVRLFWFDRSGALNFNIITLTDRLTHLSLFETRTCIPHCPTRYLTPIAINDFPTTVASDSECRSAYVRFSWYNVKLMIRFSLVASCVFPSGHHVILSVFVLTTCFFFWRTTNKANIALRDRVYFFFLSSADNRNSLGPKWAKSTVTLLTKCY